MTSLEVDIAYMPARLSRSPGDIMKINEFTISKNDTVLFRQSRDDGDDIKANHVNKQYANIGLQYAPDTQYTNTKPTPEDGKRYNWTYVNESKTHVILGKNTCAICNDIISFTKAAKIFDMELVVCIEGDVTKYYYNTTNSAHDNTTNRESDDTTNSEAHDDTTNREPDEDYDAFLYKLHLT